MIALAVTECAFNWFTGLGLIPRLRRRTGRTLSAAAFDDFTTVVNGSKQAELEHRQSLMMLRDDEGDGAPPHSRIDLEGGTARIVLPNRDGQASAGSQEPRDTTQ
ncbi:DUF6191 domain-containing protein [Streptomyces hygroscopicus]|uniref:DUF6191 domain-containing protein n=1 Tax=Streptomyces hygroscopicus TaxID=1912 RepID=UPI00223F5E3F|nr:DUF6191 domain-containing protein [Streptomyces hygroscopicus]